MAENNILTRPTAKQILNVPVPSSARLEFAFDPSDATLARDGEDLVFSFEDGAKIVLEMFYDAFSPDMSPPVLVVQGQELPGEDFLAALGDPDLMPLAGPAGMTVGGGSYADSLLAGVGGVTRLGKMVFDADAPDPTEEPEAVEGVSDVAATATGAAGLVAAAPLPTGPGEGGGDEPVIPPVVPPVAPPVEPPVAPPPPPVAQTYEARAVLYASDTSGEPTMQFRLLDFSGESVSVLNDAGQANAALQSGLTQKNGYFSGFSHDPKTGVASATLNQQGLEALAKAKAGGENFYEYITFTVGGREYTMQVVVNQDGNYDAKVEDGKLKPAGGSLAWGEWHSETDYLGSGERTSGKLGDEIWLSKADGSAFTGALNTGEGADSVVISGSAGGKVDMGGDDNRIEVTGGTRGMEAGSSITTGEGRDVITITCTGSAMNGGSEITDAGGDGNEITLTAGYAGMTGGSAVRTSVESAGNDGITVTGGSFGVYDSQIDTGKGAGDTIRIEAGEAAVYSGSISDKNSVRAEEGTVVLAASGGKTGIGMGVYNMGGETEIAGDTVILAAQGSSNTYGVFQLRDGKTTEIAGDNVVISAGYKLDENDRPTIADSGARNVMGIAFSAGDVRVDGAESVDIRVQGSGQAFALHAFGSAGSNVITSNKVSLAAESAGGGDNAMGMNSTRGSNSIQSGNGAALDLEITAVQAMYAFGGVNRVIGHSAEGGPGDSITLNGNVTSVYAGGSASANEVITGEGDDRLVVNGGMAAAADAGNLIDMGGGEDVLQVSGAMRASGSVSGGGVISSALNEVRGSGNLDITVKGGIASTNGGRTRISAAGENDAISIDTVFTTANKGKVEIDTGGGVDSLHLKQELATADGAALITTGEGGGDDTLLVHLSGKSSIRVDGLGVNTISTAGANGDLGGNDTLTINADYTGSLNGALEAVMGGVNRVVTGAGVDSVTINNGNILVESGGQNSINTGKDGNASSGAHDAVFLNGGYMDARSGENSIESVDVTIKNTSQHAMLAYTTSSATASNRIDASHDVDLTLTGNRYGDGIGARADNGGVAKNAITAGNDVRIVTTTEHGMGAEASTVLKGSGSASNVIKAGGGVDIKAGSKDDLTHTESGMYASLALRGSTLPGKGQASASNLIQAGEQVAIMETEYGVYANAVNAGTASNVIEAGSAVIREAEYGLLASAVNGAANNVIETVDAVSITETANGISAEVTGNQTTTGVASNLVEAGGDVNISAAANGINASSGTPENSVSGTAGTASNLVMAGGDVDITATNGINAYAKRTASVSNAIEADTVDITASEYGMSAHADKDAAAGNAITLRDGGAVSITGARFGMYAQDAENSITGQGSLHVEIICKNGGIAMYAAYNGAKNTITGNSDADTSDFVYLQGKISVLHAAENIIATGDGDDSVHLAGEVTAYGSGMNFVQSGDGDDSIRLSGKIGAGSLTLRAGDGHDALILEAADPASFRGNFEAWFNALGDDGLTDMGIESIRVMGAEPGDSGVKWLEDIVTGYNAVPGGDKIAFGHVSQEGENTVIRGGSGMDDLLSGTAESADIFAWSQASLDGTTDTIKNFTYEQGGAKNDSLRFEDVFGENSQAQMESLLNSADRSWNGTDFEAHNDLGEVRMSLSESAATLTITTAQGQSQSVVMEGFTPAIEADDRGAEQIAHLLHEIVQVGG